MKKIKRVFPVFYLSIFIYITCFTTSCDDYKSEEFEISALDSKACQQLQTADSLGADTIQTIDLASIDSTIAVDTMAYNLDSVLVDTTLYFTWTNEMIYDSVNAKYKYVAEILDTLIANDIVLTNTSTYKLKLITPNNIDIVYFALETNSSSLTFFFDKSVSINLINHTGGITKVSYTKIPLETAAGCTKLDDNDVEVPFIIARYEISVPENVSLLQLIKNGQTGSDTIHVSIL